jgi:hypothetical protein
MKINDDQDDQTKVINKGCDGVCSSYADTLLGNPKRKVLWAQQQVFSQYETKV